MKVQGFFVKEMLFIVVRFVTFLCVLVSWRAVPFTTVGACTIVCTSIYTYKCLVVSILHNYVCLLEQANICHKFGIS